MVPAFWLLAVVNVFVGSMVGMERTVVPLLAEQDFGITAGATIGSFIVAFAIAKAVFNLFAGAAADRWGRRRVLILGWVVSLPVAPLLAWAPTWGTVVAANLLLGVGQALTWSMTLNMMVDLMPARRRGFAAGINEFAGYFGVSVFAFLTGLVAAEHGLRPWPFVLGIGVSVLGLALSLGSADTRPSTKPAPLRWIPGVGVPSLLGLATNLKDGLVWLSLPILLTARGFDLPQVAVVAGLYPFVWAVGQPLFGPLSDRIGRRLLVAGGMLFQGAGLLTLSFAWSFTPAVLAALLLGLGTGMAYPVLIAAVTDRVEARERATALGVYRFFRDSGYALGALLGSLGLLRLGAVNAWTAAAFAPLVVIALVALRSAGAPAGSEPAEAPSTA